ncbi:MAG: DUF695 domain-containing protein [Rectinemataceae bacterium]
MAWLAKTQTTGDKTYLKVDDRLENKFPINQLPILYSIKIFYNSSDIGDGIWDPEESTSLDGIEDSVFEVIAKYKSGFTVYLIRVDGKGLRNMMFYADDAYELDKIDQEIHVQNSTYRIECTFTMDHEWAHYRKYLQEVKG